jgi:hypothetical protein
MKALATLTLLLSLPGTHFTSAPKAPEAKQPTTRIESARRGGRWYFAESGHAVYCYGPVVLVPDLQDGVQHVATFCQGDKPMVPLKD